jgi:ABC-type nitrate/sulfonate/bicarbonate transport system substrate-binding protein
MVGLKIGGVPEHFNLPWRLAIEEGKFKEIGLDLHWSDMNGGTGQMARGLETGSIDIAVILTEGITKAILNGLQAKILDVYVDSPLIWGIHVPYESFYNTISDLENKSFAISREGSGSHLMTYLLAEKMGWDNSKLKFNVVGDVYGGLWALQNDASQAFLWERYTTEPFCDLKKCRRIDTISTPWPCFAIAVRTDLLVEHQTILEKMLEVIRRKSFEIMSNEDSAQIIAWRYNLKLDAVMEWLKITHWSTSKSDSKDFTEVVNTLLRLDLIDKDQSMNWQTKLFTSYHSNKII